MNRFYDIIGELKVYEICEHYRLSSNEMITLMDVFTRFDAVEKFLETESEQRILEARADIVAGALQGSRRARALCYAIISICDEFCRIKDAVYQLKDLQQEGMLLH